MAEKGAPGARGRRSGSYIYEVLGFAVEAAEPIPGLAPSRRRPSARFSLRDRDSHRLPPDTEWRHRATLPDGRAWPAFGDSASGYVLDFEGACSFLISERGASIDATPYADVPADLIQRLFLDQVIPLLVHLSGRECLHASAVLGPTGAYAFLGPSGAGKSTLAAALALRGCALLCDDCLALVERPPRGIFVLPGHRGSRLWPDSAEALSAGRALHALAGHPSKRALAAGQEPRAEAPLRGIYILEPAPSAAPLEIVPAGPQQVVPALLESSFRLDLRNSELLSRQFRFLMRLAASVPIRLLRYPHSFPALPALCRRILADAAERCPSSC